MGFALETQRSLFFQELSEEKRKEFFSLKNKKFLPTIDNLYYCVFIKDDCKDNPAIEKFIKELTELKSKAAENFAPVDYKYGLQVTLKSYKMYRLCITEHDLYDIFVCGNIPNDITPRICVQIRSIPLWTRGVEEILTDSYNNLDKILSDYGLEICRLRENRVDFCYHTNAITSPDKVFNEVKGRVKYLHSNLEDYNIRGKTKRCDDGTILRKDYICFGSIDSNNVRARVYDKVREVIEKGYKGFFFQLWHDNGLVNYYDKFCFEYALPYHYKEYIHRARLEFYIEHGTNEEKKKEFADALKDKNLTLARAKKLADEYMPRTTAVINIEYETKRKFYYYSDKFIEHFKHTPRMIPSPLLRLYKILDNREAFLDYLTRSTLSFHHTYHIENGEKIQGINKKTGEYEYVDWWKRLRNTKLVEIESDEKFLRDYSCDLDKKCVMVRAINNIASVAVYGDNVDTGFVADVSDLMSNITDNAAHVMVKAMSEYGEVMDDIEGDMLKYYSTKKAAKEKLLKNRKKRKKDADAIKTVDKVVRK